jgi:hypothetical protein
MTNLDHRADEVPSSAVMRPLKWWREWLGRRPSKLWRELGAMGSGRMCRSTSML